MKKYIVIGSLLSIVSIQAQSLSLNEALRLSNSYQKDQSRLETQIQQIQKNILKQQQFPTISGEATLQRNLIVPVTPVPSIAFDPNAQPGEITPLKFATDWNAKAGIQVSWDVFNPQKQWNQVQNKIQYQKALLNEKEVLQNTNTEIIDLYAQAYLAQQQLQIAIANEQNYQQTLEIIVQRAEVGRATEVEKNNALKKSIELQMTRQEAQVVLQNKYLMLLEYIDVSKYDHFSTSIEEILSQAFEKDTSLQQQILEWDVKFKQKELKYNKKAYLPTITLNGYYGAQFFNNDLKLFQSDYWYGNSYINVGVKVPISDWIQKSNKDLKTSAEYDLAESKWKQQQVKDEQMNLQKQNEIALLNEKITQQKKIVVLLESNKTIVEAQVKVGVVLVSEYNKELEAIQEAYKKLWQHQYDLINLML